MSHNTEKRLHGSKATVTGVLKWPNGLPLLHPKVVLRILSEKLVKKQRRSLVNKYDDAFLGEDVIECLASQADHDSVRTKPSDILEYLEQLRVIIPVGHVNLVKSRPQRLFRLRNANDSLSNIGALFVNIDSAQGLLAENMSGTSNPFVEVEIGEQSCTTKVISQELNPRWNESFVFFVQFEERTGQPIGDGTSSSSGDITQAMKKQNLEALRNELAIRVQVFAHRKSKGRTVLGKAKKILVKHVHTSKRSVKEINLLPTQAFTLHRQNSKAVQPVLLALRTALNKGGAKTRNNMDGGPNSVRSGASRDDSDDNIDMDDGDNFDQGSDQEDGTDSDSTNLIETTQSPQHMTDGTTVTKKDGQGTSLPQGGASVRKMGSVSLRVLWMPLEKQQTMSKPTSLQNVDMETMISTPFRVQGDGRDSRSKEEEDDDDEDIVDGHDGQDVVGELVGAGNSPPPAKPNGKNPRSLEKRSSSSGARLKNSLLRRASSKTTVTTSNTTNHYTNNSNNTTVGGGGSASADENEKKKQPGRMSRMLSRRSKLGKSQTISDELSEDESRQTGVSRLVLYDTMKKRSRSVIFSRLEEIRTALANYTKGEAKPAEMLRTDSLDDVEGDIIDNVQCFLFEFPERAFDLLADESGKKILRSMWVALAPLFPPLCHYINAHQVFSALLLAQNGEKAVRAATMSGQIRSLKFPTFLSYVRALQTEKVALGKGKAKLLQDFPGLGADLLKEGEEILRIVEKVKGGGVDSAFIRKSQTGGKMVITTHGVYYAKKRLLHQNHIQREDLRHAVQVLESNGSVEYGLMVGFSNKLNKSQVELEVPDSLRVPSMNNNDSTIGPASEQSGDDAIEETFIQPQEVDDDEAANKFLRTMFDDPDDSDLSGAEDSTVEDSEGKSSSASTTPKQPKDSLKSFEFKFPSAMVARYVVYRFPSSSSWRRRDSDILILREIIAFRIFCDSILRPIIQNYALFITDTSASPGTGAPPAMIAKEAFTEYVITYAKEILVQDVLSFKALLRLQRVDGGSWDWLNGVDTFEAFGDRWTWRKWTPLALLNCVCAGLQPTSQKSAAIKRKSISVLCALATDLVMETAYILSAKVEWKPSIKFPLVSITRFSLKTRLQQSEASLEVSVVHPNESTTTLKRNNGEDAATGKVDDTKSKRKSVRVSIKAVAGLDEEVSLVEEDEEPGTDRAVELITSLDHWWIELAGMMQGDIVRSAARLKSLGQNFALLKSIVAPVREGALEAKAIYQSVITWESPMLTVGLGVTSLVLVLSGYTAYFTGLLLGSFALYLLQLRTIRHAHGFSKLYVPPRQKKTLLQKYRDIKRKYSTSKHVMQQVNLVLLKVRAVLTWENESVTFKLFLFLAVLALLVTFAPRMFYELAFWAWFFTKRFRSGRISRKIKAFLVNEWQQVPPTPLWEKTTT